MEHQEELEIIIVITPVLTILYPTYILGKDRQQFRTERFELTILYLDYDKHRPFTIHTKVCVRLTIIHKLNVYTLPISYLWSPSVPLPDCGIPRY